MAVPAEIRAVERPKNTIVVAYGPNKDKYAVRIRTGCKYENGRRLPVTGPTIGHIVNGKYIPDPPKPGKTVADLASTEVSTADGANDEAIAELQTTVGALSEQLEALAGRQHQVEQVLRDCMAALSSLQL